MSMDLSDHNLSYESLIDTFYVALED